MSGEKMRARLIAICAVSVVTAATTQNAAAAVRKCMQTITGTATDAVNEQSARRKAMLVWTDQARMHGPEYVSWRLATDRAVTCSQGTAGGFTCQATAAPCTILQNPNQMPPDFKVVPRNAPASGIKL